MISEQWFGDYNTRQDQEKRQYQLIIFEIILLETYTYIYTRAREYTNSGRHKHTYAHISHRLYVYLPSTKFNHQGLFVYTGYKQMGNFTTK